ncbi:PMS1 protein homolog 1 isoform X2 [Ranitomeya imitator]|uniref:PMS1 protein homolog 1 isoform X2 n=1 Tax=Ranitomeya imitator TaxID=111125 RepID=UPI0037E8226B
MHGKVALCLARRVQQTSAGWKKLSRRSGPDGKDVRRERFHQKGRQRIQTLTKSTLKSAQWVKLNKNGRSSLRLKALLNMHQLSSSTVRLLSSSQVITAVVSVVKELVENALDALATNVEVKLENFGFDKIEVRDNGIGIKAADTSVMGIKHYTSKISSYEDLETLQTYGFRGEALGSICSIAEVHITTKTATEPFSTEYYLDNNGHVVSQKPSHLGQGTTVTAMKLFKNVPVRKQYYATEKKCKEELRKVQDLLISYGLIKPDVRIVLVHNKVILWQKNKVSDQKMALISVLGTTVMNAMAHIQHQCENPEMVRMHYNRNKDSSRFYPIFFMNILVPPSSVDVNLTPDKTQVLLHNKEFIFEAVEKVLKSLYPDLVTTSISKTETPSKDNNINHIDSPSEDQHKINIENKNMEEENLSLSPINNNGKSEMRPYLYVKDQSSSCDHTREPDTEQAGGKKYSGPHSTSSSSDQVNQKDAECSSYTDAQIQEIQAVGNTTSNNDLLITDDTWSRGNAFRSNAIDNIQPVAVMCPSAVSHCGEKSNEAALNKSRHENTDNKTKNIITEKPGFITAYDLMNNRVTKRPVSAIDIFTQEHRASLLNDSPEVPVDEIASVTLELWEKLSEEEKLRYEEKAATDLQRYKMQTAKATGEAMPKTGKRLKQMLAKSPAQKVKLKTPMSNQQILDKLFYSQMEKKNVVPAIKTVKISFSLYNLKQKLFKLGRKEMLDFEEITLITKLNLPGAWIVASNKDIALLNPYRVEEALLYKRLAENHKMSVEKLELPIILNERLIGGPEYFTALLSMQKDSPRPNGHVYFSDLRLAYNGFLIKVIPGSSNIIDHVEIEGMTGSLPFYGISDLKEVLSSVMNGNTNLCDCRPLKVLNYLEGEAVRLARQLTSNLSTVDIQDTMHRMKQQLNSNQTGCIHGRPFFHHLLDIPESDI